MISDEQTNLSNTPGHESCLSSRFTRLDYLERHFTINVSLDSQNRHPKKKIHTNYSEMDKVLFLPLWKRSVLGQTRCQPLDLFCSSRAGFPRKCFSPAKLKNSRLQQKNSLRAFVGSSFPKSITLIYYALLL